MIRTYTITGMTCEGCKASVTQALESLPGITGVAIDLETGETKLEMETMVSITEMQQALSSKYRIKESRNVFEQSSQPSKLVQLRPLLLIFVYLVAASVLLNYSDWDVNEMMLDFMGLFFIVFSFFKILDLKGFPSSFSMYDPLAKSLSLYAWIYPFVETALGIMFLMRLQVGLALIITVVILGITTIGVGKTLLDKKTIRCACLGTALKLPMTEATIIENVVMILMAVYMLVKTAVL